MNGRWKNVGSAIGLIALLCAAGFVAHTKPEDSVRDAPFEVRGTMGVELVGRNVAATVTSARFVDAPEGEILGENWVGETAGSWLLVDLEAACVVSMCQLQSTELRVDGTSWSASERSDSLSLRKWPLSAGIATSGSLLFEVPSSLADDAASAQHPVLAELWLAVASDIRLDSVLVVSFDLAVLEHVQSARLVEPEWAQR